MGVPVIATKGNHFLSHLGESIAHNSGLSGIALMRRITLLKPWHMLLRLLSFAKA